MMRAVPEACASLLSGTETRFASRCHQACSRFPRWRALSGATSGTSSGMARSFWMVQAGKQKLGDSSQSSGLVELARYHSRPAALS